MAQYEATHLENNPADRTFADILAERRAREERKLWHPLARTSDVGRDLSELFRDMGAIVPSKQEQGMIARLLTDHIDINFMSIVCPDYATKKDGDATCYTFDSLGDGIGIVADRALDVCVRLSRFFAEQKTSRAASFTLAIADQEANEENCKRVGLGREDFLAKLRKSQQTLSDRAKTLGVEITTPLLTEMDPARWTLSQEKAEHLTEQLPHNLLHASLRSRSSFYERWAGRYLRETEIAALFFSQVKDYVAVGAYVEADNRVILGLDAPIMAPFVRRGAATTPVIYFKRPDY